MRFSIAVAGLLCGLQAAALRVGPIARTAVEKQNAVGGTFRSFGWGCVTSCASMATVCVDMESHRNDF